MSQTITYTFSVTIVQPVDEGDNPEDYVARSQTARMEREIIRLLEKTYGRKTVDCECMETEIKGTVDARCCLDNDKGCFDVGCSCNCDACCKVGVQRGT